MTIVREGLSTDGTALYSFSGCDQLAEGESCSVHIQLPGHQCGQALGYEDALGLQVKTVILYASLGWCLPVVTNDMFSFCLQGLGGQLYPDQEAHPAVLASGVAASHPHVAGS